jgi:hypothetical protein
VNGKVGEAEKELFDLFCQALAVYFWWSFHRRGLPQNTQYIEVKAEKQQRSKSWGSMPEEEDQDRLLLPVVVKSDAKNMNSNRHAYSFPITDNPAKGLHYITNRNDNL